MMEENKVTVVDAQVPQEEVKGGQVMNITDTSDDIILLAETAEKKVNALKKVMDACLSITTPHDWVLIGGKPYLQESGCTKVGNLIGISFEICPGFPIIEVDSKGYKTFTYRVRAFSKNGYVEGEGQRCMRDDFFAKKKDGMKEPEEINERDVRIAALTNAKANAIKSIIPGLKNIEIDTLAHAGLDTKKIQGYTFKTGKDGGKSGKEEEFECEVCHKKVNGGIASYSQAHFSGHLYCLDCQARAARAKERVTGEVVAPYDPNEEE